jgi:hypothetical protein
VKKQASAIEKGKLTMLENLLDIIVWISLIRADPHMLNYLGLAAVHLLAALCYLKHEGGLPLALCAGTTSALYLNLAMLHGVVH